MDISSDVKHPKEIPKKSLSTYVTLQRFRVPQQSGRERVTVASQPNGELSANPRSSPILCDLT